MQSNKKWALAHLFNRVITDNGFIIVPRNDSAGIPVHNNIGNLATIHAIQIFTKNPTVTQKKTEWFKYLKCLEW